jgi:hypothetical protein
MPTDLELLRRFEPVVRYTEGEMFFPTAIDGYLPWASLWQELPNGPARVLQVGEVTPETLAAAERRLPGAALYLRFTQEPMAPLAYQAWLSSSDHPPFSSVGRLSRVGIIGRLVETGFDFSLLLRGRVPGGTTAAAQRQYSAMLAEDPRYVYYGRVMRDGDYTVLHYLFFYAMNDWRSSFHGVNDHESDWEQIFVYVTEEGDDFVPQWVAFAAHDFSGDDLRRRWDDPQLDKVDDSHVVVYAGAGSHAAYVEPGEYLMHVEPAPLHRAKRIVQPVRDYLSGALSVGQDAAVDGPVLKPGGSDTPLFSLAFVDYARGDGRAIGPGQPDGWSPELLTEDLPWVMDYRGLWGFDTRDPFGGERGPAGPKFNRDGSVRQTWYDPLGWSGLDKVPAPALLQSETEAAIADLAAQAAQIRADIDDKRAALRGQGVTVAALAQTANIAAERDIAAAQLAAAQTEINHLTAQLAEVGEKERLLRAYLAGVLAGERGDPQAHLRRRAVPEPPPPRMARLMDAWAASSAALLVTTLILLVVLRPPSWLLWMVAATLLFGLIEATFRKQATGYLMTVTIILAAVAAMGLAIQYWQWVIPAALVGVAVYSLIANIRELRSQRPR